MAGRTFTTQASQEAYELAHEILEVIAGEHGAQSTCIHCQRPIQMVDGEGWIDPAATGDDGVWRDSCYAHDTREADHESAREDLADALADEIARLVSMAMDAYGDERYEDGNSDPANYERGYNDAVDELDYEAAQRSPMARAWQLRFAPTGLIQGVWDADREAGTLSLVVSEWDAWTVLRVLDGAEVAR